MSSSIKVTDRTKDCLERLQAEIRLETGRRVTQQELLETIVTERYASKADVLEEYRDEFEGLSEAEIEQWLSGTIDSGVETTEEEIDEILYGE